MCNFDEGADSYILISWLELIENHEILWKWIVQAYPKPWRTKNQLKFWGNTFWTLENWLSTVNVTLLKICGSTAFNNSRRV